MRARHARRPDPAVSALRGGRRRRLVAEVWRTSTAVTATAGLTVAAGLGVWAALPALAGWHVDVVMSGSMAPAIRTGDLVLSEPVEPSTLRPGQVALFHGYDGRTLVHRVQDVADDGSLTTRGDANASADPGAVQAGDVLGLARLRVPLIGLPVVWWEHRAWLPLGATVLASIGAVAAVSAEDERRRGRHLVEAVS